VCICVCVSVAYGSLTLLIIFSVSISVFSVFSCLCACSLSLSHTHTHTHFPFSAETLQAILCLHILSLFLVFDMSPIFCCTHASLLPQLCVNHVEKTNISGQQIMLCCRYWYVGVHRKSLKFKLLFSELLTVANGT